MKTKQILKSSKNYIVLTAAFFCSQFLMAQDVSGDIEGWGEDVKTALDAAVAVFAIVGGFIIFIQYMQGNEQAQKNFIKFCIGLGIFALAEGIVGTFVTAA